MRWQWEHVPQPHPSLVINALGWRALPTSIYSVSLSNCRTRYDIHPLLLINSLFSGMALLLHGRFVQSFIIGFIFSSFLCCSSSIPYSIHPFLLFVIISILILNLLLITSLIHPIVVYILCHWNKWYSLFFIDGHILSTVWTSIDELFHLQSTRSHGVHIPRREWFPILHDRSCGLLWSTNN